MTPWASHSLHARSDINLSTLETIKEAWSSPSACVKANWCRIPVAIIIAFGLMFLFTFFCCCAQCLACCCCRRSRQKPRGFGDFERGGQTLLPHSGSFGQQADLPSMPSYAMTEYKKPTYAVIGEDGSVTTEDPEKRLGEDFPTPAYEAPRPLFPQRTGVVPGSVAGNDMFTNANSSFHNPLNDNIDTSYHAGGLQNSVPPYRSSQTSPTRQQLLPDDHESTYSGAPPSFTTLPRPGRDFSPSGPPIEQPTNYNSSRGQFNDGGPFPIIGRRAVPASRPLPAPQARPLPPPGVMRPLSESPPPAPYPVGSLRHENSSNTLRDDYEFDPYNQKTNYNATNRF